jgi:hypothetical protein
VFALTRYAAAVASVLCAAAAACAAAGRLAAQVTVAVSAPATLAAGEPALVRVEVTAPAAAQVRVVPPDVTPFAVARAGRVPTAPGGAGPGWRRHEWRYVLAPPAGARGRYAFAPFAAAVDGPGLRPWTAHSRPWALVVRPPAAAGARTLAGGFPGAVPAGAAQPAPGARRATAGVTFRARAYPDTVVVGQQVTYELAVAVDAGARERIRRNPEFVPPELRGVLAVDLPASHEATGAGDLHVYRRALFALAPGAVTVPSARLSYALATGVGYFSPEERLSLRTEPVRFVAVPAPAAGRPRGWTGAVGSLRAAARVATPEARAGDPVEFVVRLEGEGNLALLPRPALAVAWAEAVEAGERVEVDSSAAVIRGAKEFTWLLTPRAPGAYATPALRYPFFDPGRRVYDEAVVRRFRSRSGRGCRGGRVGPARGGDARRSPGGPRHVARAVPRAAAGACELLGAARAGAGAGPARAGGACRARPGAAARADACAAPRHPRCRRRPARAAAPAARGRA